MLDRVISNPTREAGLHEEANDTSANLRAEINRLTEALDFANRLANETRNAELARDAATAKRIQEAEILRRRLEVESCKAEVALAERLAISAHHNAEKQRLIEHLTSERDAVRAELTALQHEHAVVMKSRSMAITKLMRDLIELIHRIRG
jgi:hypothetical protein